MLNWNRINRFTVAAADAHTRGTWFVYGIRRSRYWFLDWVGRYEYPKADVCETRWRALYQRRFDRDMENRVFSRQYDAKLAAEMHSQSRGGDYDYGEIPISPA